VTDYSGKPWVLGSRSMIASNGRPSLHRGLQEAISLARGSNNVPAAT
jgi:hypothetical protein